MNVFATEKSRFRTKPNRRTGRRVRHVLILAFTEQSRHVVWPGPGGYSLVASLRGMKLYDFLLSLSRGLTVLMPQPISLHSESTEYDYSGLSSGPPVSAAPFCIRPRTKHANHWPVSNHIRRLWSVTVSDGPRLWHIAFKLT
jgi:hypothetical protein